MDVDSILLKIKLLMNKVDSQDYDNFEIWQLLEAYNRSQLMFVRANLRGINILQEGDEASKQRIDDFNILLTSKIIPLVKKDERTYLATPVPDDYMMYKSMKLTVCRKGCTNDKIMKVYLAKVANADILYSNTLYCPSFEWSETFTIRKGPAFEIYVKDFDVTNAELLYYRYPKRIAKAGHVDVGKNIVASADQGSEFSDDLTELIIQETALLLSGDIQDAANHQVRQNIKQTNN